MRTSTQARKGGSAMRAFLMGLGLIPALLVGQGCAGTTTGAARGVEVRGPEPRGSSATVKPGGGPGTGAAASAPDTGPKISSKAMLSFEDGVKAYEAQRNGAKQDYPALERKFRAAVEADRNLAEAEYNLGVLAERQGRTKDAVAHYRAALDRKPTLRQAAENLAVLSQNEGDEEAAVAVYRRIAESYPEDGSARARLAEIARRRGDSTEAMELAKEALYRDPKSLQAYKTMMLVHLEAKQLSMVRLVALRAQKIDANDPEIFHALGLAALVESDKPRARTLFKRAVEARRDFLPAHVELAKMAMALEDFGGAETHLRAVLQASGASAEALLNLGVAYKGRGQLDKAMAAYDEASKVNPKLPAIALNRGIVVALKGDPEKAITYFRQYVDLGGESPVVSELLREQELVIENREQQKRALEEAERMEAEVKRQEAAAKEEEKQRKAEELRQKQLDARGQGAPPSSAPAPEPSSAPATRARPATDDTKPREAPRGSGGPQRPKKPGPDDEPADAL